MRFGILLACLALAAMACTVWADTGAPSTAARCPEELENPNLPHRTAPATCDPALLPQELRAVAPEGYVPPPVKGSRPEPPCELECPECAYLEAEPWPETDWEDVWNGGCNSDPNVFEMIDLRYAQSRILTICGTSGTYDYYGSTYRDTDWFEFEVTEPTTITYCCTAEFPVYIFIIDGDAGCASPVILEQAYGDTCETACLEYEAAPGTYWFWVAPAVFSGVPPGAQYVATIEGLLPEWCAVDCPFGALESDEPMCCHDYEDHWDGGCNSDPYVFWELGPSGDEILLCGTSGVYPYMGSSYRDTDWFEIVLDEPREVSVTCVGEFPLQLLLVYGTEGCPGNYVMYSAMADPCMEANITEVLPPGVYWIWVGPQYWDPIGCGWRYIFSVEGYTTPVESLSWGTIKGLYR